MARLVNLIALLCLGFLTSTHAQQRRLPIIDMLRGVVEAGYGQRVMFGSDQMVWPGLIEAAIRSIEEAPFLTRRQKRDIFYNNAARFLRLSSEENKRHHRM